MKVGRGMFSRRCMLPLLLWAGLLAGCGDGSDESAPALTFTGTTPLSHERSRSLAGTVEPGVTLQVTVDTAAEVNGLLVTDGSWSCNIDGLALGANVVTLQAADATGNRTVTSLTLLYEPLSIERWVTPLPGDTLTIGGLKDPSATEGSLVVSVEPAVETAAPPVVSFINPDHWQADLSGLAGGDNVVTVTFTPAGLEAVTQTLTVNVDTSAPVVTIDPVASPTAVDTQEISGGRSSDRDVSLSAPTAVISPVTYPTPDTWSASLSGLTRGKNPVTASVTDENGITATARDTIIFKPTP